MRSFNREDIVGIYRHYKGNLYFVADIGVHTETEERMVIYYPKYNPYKIWLRPLDMFMENVVVNGEEVPRFQKLT